MLGVRSNLLGIGSSYAGDSEILSGALSPPSVFVEICCLVCKGASSVGTISLPNAEFK